MLRIQFSIIKYLFKHRFFLGFLAIIWITGTIISVYLISFEKQTKLEVQKKVNPTVFSEEADHVQSVPNYKMADAIRYCNPPNSIKRGDEGKPPVNGSLEFVAVMFRHGDRGPLRPIRNQTTINCGSTDDPLLRKYLGTFKHLRDSAKHLVDFMKFPLYPLSNHCILQQVTLLGVHQLLMLGKAFKKAYIEENNLLNASWTSEQIKVYSTVYSRTFQSSLAFLFGFLPSFNISNINIFPVEDHRFCMSEYYCDCQLALDLGRMQTYKRKILSLNDPEIQKVIQQLMPIVKRQPEEPSIKGPFSMYDALMGFVCHAAPLPCIPGTNECATFENLSDLITHLKWVDQQLLADDAERKTQVMKILGFLKHLVYRINKYISGRDLVRFALYSAHDLSMSGLFTVLGINDGSDVWVPYAAHIAFEVYSRTENKNGVEYFFKVVYNGKDVTQDVSFCKLYLKQSKTFIDASNYGLCPLKNFQEFVAGLVSSIGFPPFKTACNSQYVIEY